VHVVVVAAVLLRPTFKGIRWWMVRIRWRVYGSIMASGRQEDIIMLLRQRIWMLVLAEVDSESVVDMEHLAGTVHLDNVVMEEGVAVEEEVEALR